MFKKKAQTDIDLKGIFPDRLFATVEENCILHGDTLIYIERSLYEKFKSLFPGYVDKFSVTKDSKDWFRVTSYKYHVLGAPVFYRDSYCTGAKKLYLSLVETIDHIPQPKPYGTGIIPPG
jgi:hypothetical protein